MDDRPHPYGASDPLAALTKSRGQMDRNRRRMQMHEAEGHAGSTPRDNPGLDRRKVDERRVEFQQVLGH